MGQIRTRILTQLWVGNLRDLAAKLHSDALTAARDANKGVLGL